MIGENFQKKNISKCYWKNCKTLRVSGYCDASILSLYNYVFGYFVYAVTATSSLLSFPISYHFDTSSFNILHPVMRIVIFTNPALHVGYFFTSIFCVRYVFTLMFCIECIAVSVLFPDFPSFWYFASRILPISTWEATPNLGFKDRRLTFYQAHVYAACWLVLTLPSPHRLLMVENSTVRWFMRLGRLLRLRTLATSRSSTLPTMLKKKSPNIVLTFFSLMALKILVKGTLEFFCGNK